MRTTFILASCAALTAVASCAPPAPVTPQMHAATCVDAFQRYDLALLVEPDRRGLIPFRVPSPPPGIPGRRAAEAALHQYGCITFPRDLPELAPADLAGLAMPRGGRPQPEQYLHLGVVVSNEMEAALGETITGLGYPFRVKGADNLGRRLFIGPLGRVEQMDRARALASALGFDAMYPLTRIP